jgi:hypothetical protein
MRTSKKDIENLIKTVSEKSGEELTYEYSSVYGGYRLIKTNGLGAFGQSSSMERMTPNVFRMYLIGLIGGLYHKR